MTVIIRLSLSSRAFPGTEFLRRGLIAFKVVTLLLGEFDRH
jgi:hypothetical protein